MYNGLLSVYFSRTFGTDKPCSSLVWLENILSRRVYKTINIIINLEDERGRFTTAKSTWGSCYISLEGQSSGALAASHSGFRPRGNLSDIGEWLSYAFL